MNKYNTKKVAEAFARGDQFAINYTSTLAQYVRGSIKEYLLPREMSNFCIKENVILRDSFGRIFPIVVINKSNVLLYFDI